MTAVHEPQPLTLSFRLPLPQICGIIAGMLLWGVVGDITGRKWGSRSVAAIMLSGSIMLTFTPWATSATG